MLNPFFLQGSKTEQGLIQDLINEQLRMYGVEVYYLPRKYLTEKTIIKEVIESSFDNAYPIEAYVENFDGYGDNTTILSKFGIQALNELTIIISKERFEEYITPLIKDQSNIKLSSRPKEGDIIYFPLGDRLFEIKFVEHEQPFYQLQKNYVYTLKCELFRYEDEVIDTGVSFIDDNIGGSDDNNSFVPLGPIQTLTLVGTGVTATAITNIVNGAIRNIRVTNRGGGYSRVPIVGISSAPSGGITGTAVAEMIGGIVVCTDNTNPSLKSVQSVRLTNAGAGYTVAPGIRFIGGGGNGATAVSGIGTTGSVGITTIILGGSGYSNAPTVTFSTPKHVGAAATAVIDSPIGIGVSVIRAVISIGSSQFLFPGGTTGGVFYKTAPTVTFSLPIGLGNAATATATLDNYNLTGGTVLNVGITSEGKFYNPSSPPSVFISSPGSSTAVADIENGGGIDGSSIDPTSIAFSTTGRAYRVAPIVAISTGGIYGTNVPIITAIGIATIHPITGIVTAVSFSTSDSWAVGTGATIGAGYTTAPRITFSGNTAATTATATASVSVAGTITSISIGNSGYGYVSTPTVTIAAPTGANEAFRALGITTIRFNSISTTGTLAIGSTAITGINTTNIVVGDRVRLAIGHSESYNFVPDSYVSQIGVGTIFISSAGNNVGIATSVFEFGIDQCGIVTGIVVTFGGGGYITPPTVTISNNVSEKNYINIISGISTATGISTINSAGIVTSIYVTDSGYGYVIVPTITIGNPSLTSTGNFIFNEVVVGSASSTTARVKSWSSVTNILEVSNVTGEFEVGENIVGATSNASHKLRIINTYPPDNGYSDNETIEEEADSIIDFSERNPFGMP